MLWSVRKNPSPTNAELPTDNIMKKKDIRSLYYITHIENLPSIMNRGILSHNRIMADNIQYKPIYDPDIVSNRKNRPVDGKTLWDFANVYFNARNAMMYRVSKEFPLRELVVIGVAPDILDMQRVMISIGNAASPKSDILDAAKGMNALGGIWKTIHNDWWSDEDGSKRKMMAECLIPEQIPKTSFHSIYVTNQDIAEEVKKRLSENSNMPVISEPNLFFKPSKRIPITKSLYLVNGDMFFSEMQTLTISVNIVGVMGKGLASRAKYQFPGVYVNYQDACRKRKIKMGMPYLYKRETDYDLQLVADPSSFSAKDNGKWFLLFPTKNHWRHDSKIDKIEEGLVWLKKNYKKEGIESLAMPALGCGLGNLEWKEVGPLMCRYLANLDISVRIYLPQESELEPEWLAPDHLLKV